MGMKLVFAALLAAVEAFGAPLANTNELVWVKGGDLPLEGKVFFDTERPYQRIGRKWTEHTRKVNPGIGNQGKCSAGLSFRFSTDSNEITLRWSVLQDLSMPGLSNVARSGLDIYEYVEGVGWQYYHDWRFATPRNYPVERNQIYTIKWTPNRPCWIYLPNYNELGPDFAIGLRKGSNVKPLPPRKSGIVKPVVFYGSSITHGADASRTGLAFVNIAGRLGDFPVVNMGFSGGARNEDVVCDMIMSIEASCYVIDSLGNSCADAQYEKSLRRLREARPGIPIVLSGYTGRASEYRGRDEGLRLLYERLKREDPTKWSRLHYLSTADFVEPDGEDTADGCHPNTWGMVQIGRKYAELLPKIIRGE